MDVILNKLSTKTKKFKQNTIHFNLIVKTKNKF